MFLTVCNKSNYVDYLKLLMIDPFFFYGETNKILNNNTLIIIHVN